MGETANANASRPTRCHPVVRSSRQREEMRWVISPSAEPPKVVAIQSLMDAGSFSPRNSHIKLPAAAKGTDSQKP